MDLKMDEFYIQLVPFPHMSAFMKYDFLHRFNPVSATIHIDYDDIIAYLNGY